MVNKVLLIGINYTGTNSELNGCINDVNNMRKYLEKHYHIDQLKIMTDNSKSKLYPSKKNIIRQLKWLSKNAQDGDNLFLHYSGHGTQTIDYSGSEEDGKDECICPIDGNIIKDDDLRKYLVNPLFNNVKLVCIFDCCHSGTILDLKYHYKGQIKKESFLNKFICFMNNNKNYNKNKSKAIIININGSRDFETAADAYINWNYSGAMTYSLLTTLKSNHNITYTDLINEMNILLKRKRYTQRSQLCCDNKEDINLVVELL